MNAPTARDTIAAVATPPGIGGVGIVRISGPSVPEIARALLGRLPAARHASFSRFRNAGGSTLDEGLALYFPAPHSFTGEHVLELHGHGGPVVLDLLLQAVLAHGARPARPGEFSERAFLNGKLDLAQAEAVADLIESASAEAVRAALRSLDGAFSQRVRAITEQLIELRLHIEATLDFPEEGVDFLSDKNLTSRAQQLTGQIDALRAATRQGQLLHDGMTVVLAGPPNAGKSSLLNALAQRDSAIVSPIPGTTRDVLRERIQIDGLPLHVLDTAGLRESENAIESEGVRRAHEAMQRADRVLLVIDDCEEEGSAVRALLMQLPDRARVTLVRNKIDVSGRAPGAVVSTTDMPEFAISAQNGNGLDVLRNHLKECMGYQAAGEGTFSARRRHLDAIERARGHVDTALAQLAARRAELAAEELRQAQQALGEITGEFTSDDLLGRIFSSFCIGK
ncbi:MAG: tRNA modification GTPase TrmE [Proteobacteria bacterium]|nr:tRNA modification GTPase TrmE [Pseudomonadota bacterium]